MMDKESIVGIIKKYCKKNKDIIAVYLFGSLVKGSFNQNSDVDVALIINPELDKLEAFDIKLKVAMNLEELLGIEVDVIIFSNADLRLKHQVIKGKLIIGKNNNFRVKEESKAVNEYLDMKHFYNTYEDNMGKEFING
jgi:predicted nucleotidyltransferase